MTQPVKDREDIERAMRELDGAGLDGLLVVMLTYGPAMNITRALADTRLPVCIANTQPVPEVTEAWDMADLTYNQGIHGAQDTANALVRAGRPFEVVTGDWRSARFVESVAALVPRGRGGDPLARPAGRDLRVRDERDGRHACRRPHAARRARAPGGRGRAGGAVRAAQAVGDADVQRLLPRRTVASRSIRASPPRSVRTTRASSSASSASSARAATAHTRPTSTRSPTTAASRGSRSLPPRA